MHHKKNDQGFSLIELIVVIAIIGVLAAVAVPQFKNYMLRSKVALFTPVSDMLLTKQKLYYAKNGEFGAVPELGLTQQSAYYEVQNPRAFAPYTNAIGINGGSKHGEPHVCSDGTKFGVVTITVNSIYGSYAALKAPEIGTSSPITLMYIIRGLDNNTFATKCFYDPSQMTAADAANWLPVNCRNPGGNTSGVNCFLPW